MTNRRSDARITYAGVVATLATLIAVVVIVALVALFTSGFDRSAYGGAAYKVVEIGCRFNSFALSFLFGAVALQAVAMYSVMRDLSKHAPALSLAQRFKQAFNGTSSPPGLARNLFSTSSLLLVMFFASQLSYLVNHCE